MGVQAAMATETGGDGDLAARSAEMVEMFKAGHTSGEIAARFGVSRSTVHSAVDRARNNGEVVAFRHRNASWAAQRIRARKKATANGDVYERSIWQKGWDVRPDDAPEPLSLLDDRLERTSCRWPLGCGDGGLTLFCGIPGRYPYCEHHGALAFTDVDESEDEDDEVE